MDLKAKNIAQSLLEFYQTQNRGGDRVFLLTTAETYTSLFGEENLLMVLETARHTWRRCADQYRMSPQAPADEDALLIASYQCYLAFQESDEDEGEEQGDESLGKFIASELGEDAYDHNLQRRYFNPSNETVQSGLSFQYVVWRTVKGVFNNQPDRLNLSIPDPAKYRGRWLQYPKYQVFVNHSDIYKIGRLLSNDHRFAEDPSGESVREVLFDSWKKHRSYFNKTFRKWVEEQSSTGKIELLYCELIAKYLRQRSYQDATDAQEDLSKRIRDKRPYRRLCVEVIGEKVEFYNYDPTEDQFVSCSLRKVESKLLASDFCIFARAKGVEYNLYQEVRQVGPRGGSYLLTMPRGSVPADLLAKTINLKPYSSMVRGVMFPDLASMLARFPELMKRSFRESEFSYLIAEGGLKTYRQRYEYYEGAGPHLPVEEFPLRKIGFGIVEHYDSSSVKTGSYQAQNGGFTVVPFRRPIDHQAPKGFSLATWSYEDATDANIVGLTTQNPMPELTTRNWIESVLANSSLMQRNPVE